MDSGIISAWADVASAILAFFASLAACYACYVSRKDLKYRLDPKSKLHFCVAYDCEDGKDGYQLVCINSGDMAAIINIKEPKPKRTIKYIHRNWPSAKFDNEAINSIIVDPHTKKKIFFVDKSFCNKVIGEKRKNINYCLKIFEAINKIESDLIFDFNKNENITVKEVQHV